MTRQYDNKGKQYRQYDGGHRKKKNPYRIPFCLVRFPAAFCANQAAGHIRRVPAHAQNYANQCAVKRLQQNVFYQSH